MAKKKKKTKKVKIKPVNQVIPLELDTDGLIPIRNQFGQVTHFIEEIRWNHAIA